MTFCDLFRISLSSSSFVVLIEGHVPIPIAPCIATHWLVLTLNFGLKVVEQMKALSVQGGGKGQSKKERYAQRASFRDILTTIEVRKIYT